MINFDNTFVIWLSGIFLIALVDFIIYLISTTKAKTVILDEINNDYCILVPIFGKIKYLKNLEFLDKYSSKVYILTTNQETVEFNEQIEKICNKHNFKLFKADVDEMQEITPWLLFSIALHGKAGDKEMINSKNVILIDGDTYTMDNLGSLSSTFNSLNYDISSLRIMPETPYNITEKLQDVEYYIAMEIRKVFPYLTSGAGLIGKRDVLKRIYARHSMFFQAGDIEVGIIAKKMGYKIGYIPFNLITEVPDNLLSLTKQRLSWASGSFRLFVINLFQTIRNHPWEVIYTTLMIYFLCYYKIVNMLILFPLIIMTAYWVYIFILSIVTLKHFSLIIIFSPIYSFIQSIIILPLGALIYLRRVLLSKNLGIIGINNPKRNAKLLIGHHALYSNTLELPQNKK
jgi:Glycosyl transferase family group 2